MRIVLPGLVLSLVACSGAGGGAAVDAAKCELSFSPDAGIADNTTAVTLTAIIRDADGNPISGANVTFSATNANVNGGGATDSSGVAHANVTSDKADVKTVTAQVTVGKVNTTLPTLSVPFVAGAPEGIKFVVQPTNTAANAVITPAPTLEVFDAHGNHANGPFTASVRLVRSNGGSVQNGAAKEADGGYIVFDNLIIATPQDGYALRAEVAGSQAADESVMFDVTP